MSAYTNQTAILGEISMTDLIGCTDDGNTGNVDNTVLNQLIVNSSTDIDGKVANIYDVPFNPVPVSVSNMALTIVCYRLFRRRLTPDEKNLFYEDYKDVMEFLNDVNEGKKHLDQTPPRSFPQGAISGQASVFGPGALSTTM